MPYAQLSMTPGINVEKSVLLNSASWSFSDAIRFRDGLPEKCGGFAHLNETPLIGICTGLHSWSDLDGNPYIAAGTDQRLELYYGGLMLDITPLRDTANITPAFSTINGSADVNVKDVAHGAVEGDWINITVPVSVGGLIIQGFYLVGTVVDADNYTITAASAATATVVNGGAVPVFDTTNTSPDVKVTLANHGLIAGGVFATQVSTTVGGITISPTVYSVNAPITANTFFIQPGGAATSTATVSENGGNAQIEYLVPTGYQSATLITGWGIGDYGAGEWGLSSSGSITAPLRQWFLDNFGQDLIGNYTGSPIFVWEPPVATGNLAKAIDTTNFPGAASPPTKVNVSFVAPVQQMVIALGCDVPLTGDFDPSLLRWCSQSDFTDWLATAANTAGSRRIASGSKLVGGLAAPNFIVIWTDVDMWLMNYLGGTGLSELVWGFSKVVGSNGLLSARSCAVFRNLVFYLSSNGLYVFNGSAITLIPCPVWDKFWKNLNREQVDKVNLEVNSYYQELSIAFPSATGDGTVDSRITYNIRENVWAYDDAPTLMARTAWIDESVYGSPVGTDMAGYLQQQDAEGVYDADGAPLPASVRTGWFSSGEGTIVSMIERLETDMIITGGTGTVYVTIYTQNYQMGPVSTYGPYAFTLGSGPPYSIVRARGRFASIEISSTELGVFWRAGDIRFKAMKSGARP